MTNISTFICAVISVFAFVILTSVVGGITKKLASRKSGIKVLSEKEYNDFLKNQYNGITIYL